VVSAPDPAADAAPRGVGERLALALLCVVERVADAAPRLVAAAIAGLVFGLFRYRRRVIAENLASAFPERSVEARRALAREVGRRLARTLVSHLSMARVAARGGLSRAVRVEGLELFREALAEGKGVLVVTGHLGAFELAAAAVRERLAPARVHVVVKSLPRGLDLALRRLRRRAGIDLLPARDSFAAIVDVLRANDLVVFIIDQNATRTQGVFVDFFGRPACTYVAPSLLVDRTGCAAIAVEVFRDEAGDDVIRVGPRFPSFGELPRRQRPAARLGAYTAALEAAIRAHPADWLWSHRRWKTQPDPRGEHGADHRGAVEALGADDQNS
jgi:KDO2-lipid IV(A) lauroyltransferase